MTALLRKGQIFVAQKSEEISTESMQQSISFVITTMMVSYGTICENYSAHNL